MQQNSHPHSQLWAKVEPEVDEPYVAVRYSPMNLMGTAKSYAKDYACLRLILTTDGKRPPTIRSRSVIAVLENHDGVPYGKTERSYGVRLGRQLIAKARELNEEFRKHRQLCLQD